MFGGFGFPTNSGSSTEETTPVLKYVKLGFSNKQLAVIEVKTGSPIQYIVRQGSSEEIAKHAERVCASWELYFEALISKLHPT